jgi:Asp/Glu/hydantoin racemase
VVDHILSAADSGAVAVLATCSSIGPAVEIASRLVDVPVLRIDEPMASAAIDSGRRIGVLATVASTLNPTVDLLRRCAQGREKDVEITPVLRDEAFTAMRSGDGARHDEIIGAALVDLAADVDVIVLAQASMARVVATLEPGALSVPVLSSPGSGMARLVSVLAQRWRP